MTRMTFAVTVKTLLVAAVVSAQTTQTPPAQGQTATPPEQQKPAAPQKPATAPAFPADSKFAFVNLQYVVSESKYGKQSSDDLKKFQETRTAQLQGLEKEIEALKSKLNTQRTLMSADAARNMETDIVNKSRKLQFESETAQADFNRMQQELLEKFEAKVLPIIEAIRKERNLHAVFAQQNDPGGLAVIALDPGLDLSAEVVRRLDGGK